MFEKNVQDIIPDDDFYEIKDGRRVENSLDGKVYCVMTNQRALGQLLSLWQRHVNGDSDVFQRGLAGLRDVFNHIRTIRKWGITDRFSETDLIDRWRESLEIDGNQPAPFEIELFFRNDEGTRRVASQTVIQSVMSLGGELLQECIVPEIAYHALLVKLPRSVIEALVVGQDAIELVQIDDIMFFRPTSQAIYNSLLENEQLSYHQMTNDEIVDAPIAAILDGMPLQNHYLLKDRLIIDDPDNYEMNYEAKNRIHGTEISSLVIYGDLNKAEAPINHKVYVRPILKPINQINDTVTEQVPDTVLLVDLLHRAIKRIKDDEGNNKPVAPSVQIINFSIGDPSRQLSNYMSPIARMIDYLSYKYKVLFIISAGNHPEILAYLGCSFHEMRMKDLHQRDSDIWEVISSNQRNLRILSPAESINGLTVGATYDDFSDAVESERAIWAVSRGMPSPISAIGKGYHGIITPDLLYYGGRKFIKASSYNREKADWLMSNSKPGCRVAAPFNDGAGNGQKYSFGTSDSAAQITHEAINCYDVISQVFYNENEKSIPQGFEAIILKGMLVHGATWDSFSERLSNVTGDHEKRLSKWAGNGFPNIERVKECTKERVTLIGYGNLQKDQGALFKLPLHLDFSSRFIKRKLTVTLSYLSPISSSRQAYRSAQLWFEIDDGGKNLFPDGSRQNSEWQAVRKGTLQHEIFTGEQPVVWNNDDLIIKVSCKEDACKLGTEAIPYCLFVSFEIAEGLGIDLYSNVKSQIHQRVSIQQ